MAKTNFLGERAHILVSDFYGFGPVSCEWTGDSSLGDFFSRRPLIIPDWSRGSSNKEYTLILKHFKYFHIRTTRFPEEHSSGAGKVEKLNVSRKQRINNQKTGANSPTILWIQFWRWTKIKNGTKNTRDFTIKFIYRNLTSTFKVNTNCHYIQLLLLFSQKTFIASHKTNELGFLSYFGYFNEENEQ